MQRGGWTEPPGPKEATLELYKALGQDTLPKEEPWSKAKGCQRSAVGRPVGLGKQRAQWVGKASL